MVEVTQVATAAVKAKRETDLMLIVNTLHRLTPEQREQVIAALERPVKSPREERIEAVLRGWASIVVGERIKRAAPRGYEQPTTEGVPRNTSEDFEIVEPVLRDIGGNVRTLTELLLHVYWYELDLQTFRLFPLDQTPASDYATPNPSDYRALKIPFPQLVSEPEAKRLSTFTQINQTQATKLPERVRGLGLSNTALLELALDRFLKRLVVRITEFDRVKLNRRADLEKARRISQARSEAGKKGAEKKWGSKEIVV